ncbi:hypothetical protein N7931_15415 [Catenovulum sp. 2E275]|uniref:hypothetical protein n=1 Tax=Catenovulum sp. 2E275 TaxID=2980497 RepID=UPI0021D0B754|nr:hypothetical protein [Catenovulum sp. 2E275]MCU4677022.1 hypothetical protein [Catenovulum sp. 2E275]
MLNRFKLNKIMLQCALLSSVSLLTACGSGVADPAGKSNYNKDVEIIVLEEGQTLDDVLNPDTGNNGNEDNDNNSGEVELTADPANEGSSLFVRAEDPNQNLAGFEFCCGGFDTYQAHGFTNASGDFIKLDGGFWGADVGGYLGERVFSSYGDGYDNDADTSAAQLGASAVGSIRSPEFSINKKYINFLVGGGTNAYGSANTTAVVLFVDGQAVRQASGQNEENSMQWQSWDVTNYQGKTGFIEFVDFHPDDNSDSNLAYLLADEFRAADKAAVIPTAANQINSTAVLTSSPQTAGMSAFVRQADLNQNIAGFEFCCGKYNTYQNHSFRATGDFIYLDGGWWAADVTNHIGERAFSSRADGFEADGTGLGWIGDQATGTLTSPEFEITHQYINFLMGGGTNAYHVENATAVVLRVNGKIVRQASGNGAENKVDWRSWDVSALMGQTAVIEIIDQHNASKDDGSLAFVLVDEIRQADRAAVQPTPDSVVMSVNGHQQDLVLDMGDPNPFYDNGEYYVYYLENYGFHSWALAKTSDLLTASFPKTVLPASGDAAKADQWIGSGSVIKAQDGRYHLFYTGHNQNLSPVETVMHAVADDNTLTNWTPVSADTFTGSDGYSDYDFRDPLVFWNQSENQYWMLITTRFDNKAAIGLYTSNDLSSWNAEPPLYTEVSNLNLEVADYFELQGTPFIVYSDQRDNSRQVKYLTKQGENWIPANNDALDGRAFYAARSAGTNDERLLFGWVAHNISRRDGNNPDWGGDLLIHQLKLNNGALAVELPAKIRDGLMQAMPIDAVFSQGNVTESADGFNLAAQSEVTLAASNNKNRFKFKLTSANANAEFGLLLRKPNPESTEQSVDKQAYLKIDAANNQAQFYFSGDENNPFNPVVNLTLDAASGIDFELIADPKAGIGALYINNTRALSFRLYELADYEIGFYSTADALTVSELSRYSR